MEILNKVGNHYIGSITLSDKVIVSDPCFDITEWCNKLLSDVFPGVYKCFVKIIDCKDWGYRVSELHVIKQEVFDKYKSIKNIPYKSNPVDCIIGVDSSQCGIFNLEYYEKCHPIYDTADNEEWYKNICKITDNKAGIYDNSGVVSLSGYGDGCYRLFIAKEKSKIVAIKVVFISDKS